MYTTVIVLFLLINGLSATSSESSSSAMSDLLIKALVKTFSTPISFDETKSKFSLEIMLANDVFTLDDALRLFIQQFLLGIYDGNYHFLDDDWETKYPAYGRIISEINRVLDLISERKLSEIGMKDIRPLVATLTPTAFVDLQRLLKTLRDKAKKEEDEEAKVEL
ncbi:unnamed protein product [Adineta ricciae]|uniref:Uncharacterized protein n=1 Tax=Adineta ricciae TaxID=249248 RepID=A0A814UTB4_ADIRI|nr:unnamed protein product [Adineta ricciae]